jgi:asparagine synthase (glutamine-hydrolysing)
MCGIFGLWDSSSPQTLASRVVAGTRIAAHRGPDDEGFALLGRNDFGAWGGAVPAEGSGPEAKADLALGHRRLSIIDLSPAGHQPFFSADRRFWIILNGEIYNYIELRSELEGQGETFVSQTDTEVALTAWRAWGPSCLNRFNGMWAFAIFDRSEETLFLARDRFGVKPLYYFIRPGTFAFASETKQLLGELEGPPHANPSTLVDFLVWGLICHTPDALVEGIKSLPGGHYVKLGREGLQAGRAAPVRYWTPRPEPRLEFPEAASRLAEILGDAIRLRLRSDVPVGITLSGGLDSSSITCLASGLPDGAMAKSLKAFTVVYPDPRYSEEAYARAAAERAGVELVLVRPESPHLADDWDRFVWAMDKPFNSLSYYSNWKVYETIRAHGVPVLLNGQGGDELLLGYPRYRVPLFLELMRHGRVGAIAAEVWKGRRRAQMGLAIQLAYVLYFLLPWLRTVRRRRLARPYLRREFFELSASRTGMITGGSARRKWPDFLIQEFEHDQLPHLLHHEDAVSMHFAVEARNPFLDYRLFDLVIGQDVRYLLRDGWSKAILREAMAGTLPEPIRTRTDKMGFDTPTRRLIVENAPFFSGLLDRNEDDPVLDIAALRRDFQSDRIDEGILCAALSYLTWKERFSISAPEGVPLRPGRRGLPVHRPRPPCRAGAAPDRRKEIDLAIITHNYPTASRPNHGTFVQQFVWAMARQGARCTVINPTTLLDRRFGPLPPEWSEEDAGKSAVQVIRPRWLSYSCRRIGPLNTAHLTQRAFNRSVLEAVKALPSRPDVLYGHFLYVSGYAAAAAGRRLGIPAIPVIGEGGFWSVEHFGFEQARRHFKGTLGCLCVSTEIAKNTAHLLDIPEDRIGIFPNGIDPSFFYPRSREEMRRLYGVPEDRFVVSFVGTFNDLKGGPGLIEALAPLDNVGLFLAGTGPLRLDSRHALFNGRIPHAEIPGLLSASDVFVLPTKEEGSCNAVIEAMACGLPIVTSNGAYMDDLVDDEVAIRVDPDDVGAIRGAILKLRDDPGLRRRMSEACLKKAKLFDIDDRARRVLSWIEGLLEARGEESRPDIPETAAP